MLDQDNGTTQPGGNDSPTQLSNPSTAIYVLTGSERFLAGSGVCLVMVSVVSFIFAIWSNYRTGGFIRAVTWQEALAAEASTLVLIAVACLCSLLGLRLLTTTQNALARTIPKDDLPMIEAAVISGKSDPIDQYVRLRSLAGWAGTFTKLGITGLPLVTVILTLIFSFIALLPVTPAKDFLDLAKLTLGAFIGSFVQRSVEQRKQEASAPSPGPGSSSSLPV